MGARSLIGVRWWGGPRRRPKREPPVTFAPPFVPISPTSRELFAEYNDWVIQMICRGLRIPRDQLARVGFHKVR